MTIEIKTMEQQGSESAKSPQWTLPQVQADDMAQIGVASARRAQTASVRRAASDQRKRDAGKVKISVWLDAAVVNAIDAGVAATGRADRAEYLTDVVRWAQQPPVGDHQAANDAAAGKDNVVLLPDTVATLNRIQERSGLPRADCVDAAVKFLSRALDRGAVRLSRRG